MFNDDQINALAAALPGLLVKQRQGFSYIEGHEAIRAANRIFGYGNWQRNEPSYQRVMDETYEDRGRTMFRVGYTCKLSVTIFSADRQNAITTWGTGYGEQITSDNVGKAHEGAIKEAETDAMKRAMIALGDQFGLALYDKDQKHVDKGQQGQRAPQQQPRRDSAPQAQPDHWPPQQATNEPTPPQRRAISALVAELGWNGDRLSEEYHKMNIDAQTMTKRDASAVIERLKLQAQGVNR